MSVLTRRPRLTRGALVTVIVLDLIAVIGFAFHRTTTETTTVQPLAAAAPHPAAKPPRAATPAAPAVAAAVTARAPRSHPQRPSSGAPHDASSSGTPSAPGGVPAVPRAALGKCPAPLATPSKLGGVQSLVSFAPAFGPFSAEAFAAASAYQPVLELLGPVLAEYPKYAPVIGPLVAPLVEVFAAGSQSLFGAIEPAYAPHRPKVLAAETRLATALAPYAAKLAGTPLAGCLVDVEAALVGDAGSGNGGTTTHAHGVGATRR